MYIYLLRINKTVEKEAPPLSKALTSALTQEGFEAVVSCFLYPQQNRSNPVPDLRPRVGSLLLPVVPAGVQRSYLELHLLEKSLGGKSCFVVIFNNFTALSRPAAEAATDTVHLFSVQLFTVPLF